MIKGFSIKNITETTADLYITGEICDDSEKNIMSWWLGDENGNINGYVFPIDIKKQLEELKGKELKIYINSTGGSVFAGTAIAHMLKRHDAPTTAIVDGLAGSIATQIFFSCDNKQIPKNAYLMIHKPCSMADGDANEFLKVINALDTIQKGLESTYQDNAREGVTAEQIHELVNAGTWLTGEETAELFNVDVTEELQAVACVGHTPKNMKYIPKNLHFNPESPIKKPQYDDTTAKKTAEEKLKKQKNEITIALAMAKTL